MAHILYTVKIPFDDKDFAKKEYWFKWDNELKTWYIPSALTRSYERSDVQLWVDRKWIPTDHPLTEHESFIPNKLHKYNLQKTTHKLPYGYSKNERSELHNESVSCEKNYLKSIGEQLCIEHELEQFIENLLNGVPGYTNIPSRFIPLLSDYQIMRIEGLVNYHNLF